MQREQQQRREVQALNERLRRRVRDLEEEADGAKTGGAGGAAARSSHELRRLRQQVIQQDKRALAAESRVSELEVRLRAAAGPSAPAAGAAVLARSHSRLSHALEFSSRESAYQ
mmetsp:Transcript_1951/g.7160  ORF Transcript_1951/g.7160 Transcript_1951/m.7160 type:complete len:114 (+) Transcript_1951:435-776(+)